MKVLILAAGKGERLEPITHTRPKAFVPILDVPLIMHTISMVSRYANKSEIFIIISEDMKDYFTKKLPDVNFLIQDTTIKGTAAALKTASKLKDDEFIVIYGDLFFGEDALKALFSTDFSNVVLGIKVKNPKDYGLISVTSDGELQKIVEKPEVPFTDLINGGIYKFSGDIFTYLEKIEQSPRGEYELTDAINLMALNQRIKVETYNGYWLDLGKPWQVIDANKIALDNIEESRIYGSVEENVKIKGKVIIEEGTIVKSGTYIEGPVYIGKGAIIGPNSYVRPYTVIGHDAKVGAFVEVKESVVMEKARLPHLNYVGDSVICEDVNFGAGTLIANLRFDEAEVSMYIKGVKVNSGRKKLGAIVGGHVRTGINVSIMPGVKIGAYAWIYPNVVVKRDVKFGEKVMV